MAETWAVLTRIPLDPPISPPAALLAIERLQDWLTPVDLSGDGYRDALRRCSERGLRSGALFDALHLVAAEAEGVDAFVTLNPGDFERLRAANSPPIVIPPDPRAFVVPG